MTGIRWEVGKACDSENENRLQYRRTTCKYGAHVFLKLDTFAL